jgi:hypothetical protein
MPVQFPSLSGDTQTKRYQKLAEETLFPYSYEFNVGYGAGLYTKAQAALSAHYFSFGFLADNNLAIAILEAQITGSIAGGMAAINAGVTIEVSYSSVMSATIFAGTTPPAIPFTPTDLGNIIYRNQVSVNVLPSATQAATIFYLNDFRRYEPNNYLLKFNQILYIHLAVTDNILGLGSGMNGGVIFHALPTGLKI